MCSSPKLWLSCRSSRMNQFWDEFVSSAQTENIPNEPQLSIALHDRRLLKGGGSWSSRRVFVASEMGAEMAVSNREIGKWRPGRRSSSAQTTQLGSERLRVRSAWVRTPLSPQDHRSACFRYAYHKRLLDGKQRRPFFRCLFEITGSPRFLGSRLETRDVCLARFKTFPSVTGVPRSPVLRLKRRASPWRPCWSIGSLGCASNVPRRSGFQLLLPS